MAGQERVWLITGCSSGFGRALVSAALGAGDLVMATARRPEGLADLVAAGDGRVRTAALDVADPATIDAAVAATLAEFGRIDVVVNNAGYGTVGAVEELTMAELRDAMEVMFFGAVAVTKAVLPHLRAQGSGAIVQLSSQGGQWTAPGFGAYCAAKFALEGLSEALAAELAPLGIQVLIVEPGAFRTEFHARLQRSARIDAYQASSGAVRVAVDSMDGTQPGDPAKAADAIVRMLAEPEPPLRLALGADAVGNLRDRQTRLAEELAKWAHVSVATDLAER
jgi:NAD(P)-dependent dehydrogenase (short-subunit alcohol dehydrogenase family)